jgi:GT2 family glycosyltransferase
MKYSRRILPEVSVIILSYHSDEFIKNCLDSVFKQEYRDFEVIVVVNGSVGGTETFVKAKYPQVILIENKENLGAAKARNQGIEIAKGKWILTLDCDVILENNFLKKIISFANNSEDSAGMFQPKILTMDKKTIFSCGISLSNLRRFHDIGRGMLDGGQFNMSGHVFGACSAAALYRRRMLEEIKEGTKYFDERFFFLVEDVELSFRAGRKNWKALFYPHAICYHAGNSSGTSKEVRQYLCWRNRRLLLDKSRISKLELFPIVLCYDYPRALYLFLTNWYVRKAILCGDDELYVTYGKNSNLGKMPDAREEEKRIP